MKYLKFAEKWSPDIHCILKNVKDDKTFLCQVLFSFIPFVKVITNQPSFLVKAFDPGFKLLERDFAIL